MYYIPIFRLISLEIFALFDYFESNLINEYSPVILNEMRLHLHLIGLDLIYSRMESTIIKP